MSIDDAAKWSRIPPSTLRSWAQSGRIRGELRSAYDARGRYVPGRGEKWFVSKSDVKREAGDDWVDLDVLWADAAQVAEALAAAVDDAAEHNGMLSRRSLRNLKEAVDAAERLKAAVNSLSTASAPVY